MVLIVGVMLVMPRTVYVLVTIPLLAVLFSPLEKRCQLGHRAVHKLMCYICIFDLARRVHLYSVSNLLHALLALNADVREVRVIEFKQIKDDG